MAVGVGWRQRGRERCGLEARRGGDRTLAGGAAGRTLWLSTCASKPCQWLEGPRRTRPAWRPVLWLWSIYFSLYPVPRLWGDMGGDMCGYGGYGGIQRDTVGYRGIQRGIQRGGGYTINYKMYIF